MIFWSFCLPKKIQGDCFLSKVHTSNRTNLGFSEEEINIDIQDLLGAGYKFLKAS
jgi:hypothetical protein